MAPCLSPVLQERTILAQAKVAHPVDSISIATALQPQMEMHRHALPVFTRRDPSFPVTSVLLGQPVTMVKKLPAMAMDNGLWLELRFVKHTRLAQRKIL